MSAVIWFPLIVISVASRANGFDLLSMLKERSNFNSENVSEVCRMQLEITRAALNNFETWAWTMVDASSKIPSGIFYGNTVDFGNFDQCIALKHQSGDTVIRGKFCALSVSVPLNMLGSQFNNTKLHFPQEEIGALQVPQLVNRADRAMGLTLSICIPNACTPMEFQEYFDLSGLSFKDDNCQTSDKPDLDGGDIAAIAFLSIILFFMLASTIYDFYLQKTNQKSIHPIFLMFSVLSNGKKLLTVTKNENQINCLNGLRCISITWIIVAHRFLYFSSMPISNAVETVAWRNSIFSQYITASLIAVDTFFFLSGMMISYGYFKTVNKPKSLSFVPMLYLHRILRILPALAVVYLMSVTLIRHMGSGPIWPSISSRGLREPCLKWWWSFFLFVQNYVNYTNSCISATWYLSTDMQLFLLSPIIVMPLGHVSVTSKKKTLYVLCGLLIAASTLIPFAINFFVEPDNAYYMTHNRLSVWMVGIAAGIILEEVISKKVKVHINWMLNISIWIVVLVGMTAILLTMHDVKYNPQRIKTNVFETYHRVAWGLGLSWIVYSCTVGYGGFINSFLSYRPFQVLSRLSYCMYLTHMLVILHSLYQIRSSNYFSDFHMYYIWCGDFITTIVVSVVLVLGFESPMIILEKIIFGGHKDSVSKPLKKDIVGTKSPEV